ncbi:hypothetical protein DY000_02013476 [Brassica cretica]|uniref:Uncharacterized protein n=1 Tax=Brassica cretica TaxID=69181 RepID=A0ABQ7CS33_BRACR|nr:hypothetical protein DY000_02013476 [Brassica cretica]
MLGYFFFEFAHRVYIEDLRVFTIIYLIRLQSHNPKALSPISDNGEARNVKKRDPSCKLMERYSELDSSFCTFHSGVASRHGEFSNPLENWDGEACNHQNPDQERAQEDAKNCEADERMFREADECVYRSRDVVHFAKHLDLDKTLSASKQIEIYSARISGEKRKKEMMILEEEENEERETERKDDRRYLQEK